MGGKNSGRKEGSHDKYPIKSVCVVCGEKFKGRPNKLYCSPNCNQGAYIARKKATTDFYLALKIFIK